MTRTEQISFVTIVILGIVACVLGSTPEIAGKMSDASLAFGSWLYTHSSF